MKTPVSTEHEEIEQALARNNLPPLNVLQEAVQAGYLGRILRTANDAPNAAGFYHWNDTLRSLRENAASIGWSRNDAGSWPRTVHPEELAAIAVSSGNKNTGRQNATPSTKTGKGPRTVDAVNINQYCFAGFEPQPKKAPPIDGVPTWFLLFHPDKDELRSEISLPVSIDIDGHVTAWRERIILPALPLNPELKVPEPDFGPDVEITIAKKG